MNKKVIIWMAGILLLPLWVCAQGVNFRPLSYTEAIELAAKENKMVFIDFYTIYNCIVYDKNQVNKTPAFRLVRPRNQLF